jgi:uncharacterized protein YukE
MASNSQIGYDTAVSSDVQGEVAGIVGSLESLIQQRNSQVSSAMADFQADGVSDDYAAVEQRWRSAADEVQGIIDLINSVLKNNDDTASQTLAAARSAVLTI